MASIAWPANLLPGRSPLVVFVVLAGLLVAAGCQRVNRPRAQDDVPVEVVLERSWVQQRTPDHSYRRLPPYEAEADDLGDFVCYPIGLGLHKLSELTANGLCAGFARLGKTKVVVFPNNDHRYRQRLYWGANTVFFPVADDPTDDFLRVEVSGDRSLWTSIPCDPTTTGSVRLE